MINENNLYSLRKPLTYEEWKSYHLIRKVNIFDPLNIIYDPTHPSLKALNNYHFLFFKHQEIFGTVQLDLLKNGMAALRSVVIKDPYKNQGYGSILLKLIEETAKQFHCRVILLHANNNALAFYKKNGYVFMDFPNDISISSNTTNMGKTLESI
jgi:GNAT superfamily N-acetyltransferase